MIRIAFPFDNLSTHGHGHPLQQRGPTVDQKLAFVEHTLNQNEQAMSQLKAQRAMLLSKQQELKQEKQRIEQQRAMEQRLMLEENARQIAARKQHQKNVAVAAAEEARPSQSIRLIQGMDGRLYRVVATAEDPSDDANKTSKADEARECSSKNKATPPTNVFEVMQAAFLEAVKELEEKEEKKTEEKQINTTNASTPEGDPNGSKCVDHKTPTDASTSEKAEGTRRVSNVEYAGDMAMNLILHGIEEIKKYQAAKSAGESSDKFNNDKDIAKKVIFEGVQESSKSTSPADEIQIQEGAENKASTVEEEEKKNDKETEAVTESVEMKNTNEKNDKEVKVEDVPEVELEEVASASSSLTPKTSEGVSWMEPVDGGTVEELLFSLV
jgi:hypothetical protein